MNVEQNPYRPPLDSDTAYQGEPVRKVLLRFAVIAYGSLFTLFCVAGTVDDLVSREPLLDKLFWFAMSVLTCYGIFALAIHRFRFAPLHRFWWYFGGALPLLTYAGAGWEIYQQPAMATIEFAAVFLLFVLFTTPALVCNWMLRSRLSTPTEENG